MRLKHPKAKGRALEVRIAKDIRDSGLDKEARRMVLSGGAFGFESDIKTTLPLKIECKNCEKWEPLEFFKQAEDKAFSKTPVVIMSKNRLPQPLALLKWCDLLELIGWAIKGGWTGDLPFSKRKQVGR